MNYCPHCGATIQDDQKICIECGKKIGQEEKKEGFFGYFFCAILAVLLPIFGLILYVPIRTNKPKTAKFLLIMSIVFLIIWILMIVLIAWIGLSILFGIFTPQTEMIPILI